MTDTATLVERALNDQGLEPICDPGMGYFAAKCPLCRHRTPDEYFPLTVGASGCVIECKNGCDLRRVREAIPAISLDAMSPGGRVPGANPHIGAGTVAPPTESEIARVGTRTLRLLDVDQMLATPPPPVPWIGQPVLARGCVTMLAGREGTGKSMLALAFAAAVGHGAALAGMGFDAGRVLYIDAENSRDEAHRRLHGLSVKAGTLQYADATEFNLKVGLHELEALIAACRPDVVVLDSLRSLAPALDENDSMQAEAALRPVVKSTQARRHATLVLHHAGKVGSEYRGSTAIGAAVELGFTLSRLSEDPRAATRRRLVCWKSRPAPMPEPAWLSIEKHGDDILIGETEPYTPEAPAREEAEANLLAALNGHSTQWQEWARDAGYDPKNGTARRARDELQAAGTVVNDGQGWTRAGVA